MAKFLLFIACAGLGLSFFFSPANFKKAHLSLAQNTPILGEDFSPEKTLILQRPNPSATSEAIPSAPPLDLATFFRNYHKTIIWHGADKTASYHLALWPGPQEWQFLWQIIQTSSGEILKTERGKISAANWQQWPQRPIGWAQCHFSFPQRDGQDLSITWQEGRVKLYWHLKIMNYNGQNLWDHDPYNTDPSIMVRYEHFQKAKSNWYDPMIEKQVAHNLSKVLKTAGLPDVVAWQEIESANNQSKIFAPSSLIYQQLTDLGYQSFLLGPQDNTHPVAITTALISRYPLQAYPSLAMSPSHFSTLPWGLRRAWGRKARAMQVALLDFGFSAAALVVAHWPAMFKAEDAPRLRKVYQAHLQALKQFLACTAAPQEGANFPQCWIEPKTKSGGPLSKAMQAKQIVLPRNAAISAHLSPAVKPQIILLGDFNLSLGDPALPAGPWPDLWYTLPPEERWESVFQGRPNTLAHIFLEDSFFQNSYLQFVPGSFTVLRDFLLNPDYTPLRRQWLKIKRHGQNYYQFSGQGYSDHLPLLASINISPLKPPALTAQWQKSGRPSASLSDSTFGPKSFTDYPFLPLHSCPPLSGAKINAAHVGHCFTLDFSSAPQRLKSYGYYRHNYIVLDGHKIYLTFAPDWRQTPPQTWAQVLCFNRQVLQKKGGRLVKAQGRLGFFKDGYALFIAQRHHLQLDQLSRRKIMACLPNR